MREVRYMVIKVYKFEVYLSKNSCGLGQVVA